MRLDEIELYKKYLVDGTKGGVVMYKGSTKFGKGEWVGVELERAVGQHCGAVQGVEYFRCRPGHGIFVRPSALHPLALRDEAATKIQKLFRGHRARNYSKELLAERIALQRVEAGEDPSVSDAALGISAASDGKSTSAPQDASTIIASPAPPAAGPSQSFLAPPKTTPKGTASASPARSPGRPRREVGVWVWGSNEHGELSLGPPLIGQAKCQPRPVPLKVPDGQPDFAGITLGYAHAVALTREHGVLSCGSYVSGKLGVQTNHDIHHFRRVKLLPGGASQVACADHHTVALLDNGHIATWGGSLHGKRGTQRAGGALTVVRALEGKIVTHVACGLGHTVLCTNDGEVFTMGDADAAGGKHAHGQFGLGSPAKHPSASGGGVPVHRVHGLEGRFVTMVAAGAHHNLVLDEAKEVYSWGLNNYGQLGHGGSTRCAAPKRVESLAQAGQVSQVACGDNHSLAAMANGELFSFGFGVYGQLGHGNSNNVAKPKRVAFFSGAIAVMQVAAGSNHSIALTSQHEVFAWGLGSKGQLGTGSLKRAHRPARVRGLPTGAIKQVSAGGNHSLASIEPFRGAADMVSQFVEAKTGASQPPAVKDDRSMINDDRTPIRGARTPSKSSTPSNRKPLSSPFAKLLPPRATPPQSRQSGLGAYLASPRDGADEGLEGTRRTSSALSARQRRQRSASGIPPAMLQAASKAASVSAASPKNASSPRVGSAAASPTSGGGLMNYLPESSQGSGGSRMWDSVDSFDQSAIEPKHEDAGAADQTRDSLKMASLSRISDGRSPPPAKPTADQGAVTAGTGLLGLSGLAAGGRETAFPDATAIERTLGMSRLDATRATNLSSLAMSKAGNSLAHTGQIQTQDGQPSTGKIRIEESKFVACSHRFATLVTERSWDQIAKPLRQYLADVLAHDSGILDHHTTFESIEGSSALCPGDALLSQIFTPCKDSTLGSIPRGDSTNLSITSGASKVSIDESKLNQLTVTIISSTTSRDPRWAQLFENTMEAVAYNSAFYFRLLAPPADAGVQSLLSAKMMGRSFVSQKENLQPNGSATPNPA